MTPIKMPTKLGLYITRSTDAALLLLTAQISLTDSASWRSSPQDSAWENVNNWTPGGPPNGASDTATFTRSAQREVNITTSVELNRIVFTSLAGSADSFTVNISPYCPGCPAPGGELIFSGTGIHNNTGLLQTVGPGDRGQIIFKNTATAGDATIGSGGGIMGELGSQIIFNDSSTAGSTTLVADGGCYGASGGIVFNDTSTGGTARIIVGRDVGRTRR